MKRLALLLLLTVTAHAETNIPAPIGSRICLVLGDYSPNDFGHPSAMGGIFAARAPTNWTYAYSGIDYVGNGTTCWGWEEGLTLTHSMVDRCVSSNVALIIFYTPFQVWSYPNFSNSVPVDGVWGALRYATSKGINVLGPHYNNDNAWVDILRIKCPPCLITVGGGLPDTIVTTESHGPNLEFIDCKDSGDIAQSWANQSTTARFAHIMNDRTNFNSFDVRAYARKTCFDYPHWTNNLGYGFVGMTNRTGDPSGAYWSDLASIEAEPPLETFIATNGAYLYFFWENFLQTGWQSTVIKKNGTIFYEGPGSNLTYQATYSWPSTNWVYDVPLNGIRVSLSQFTRTNNFVFHSRVGGTLSAEQPYAKFTHIGPDTQ